MPRKSRIDTPGALQHVIIRGIERKAIFRDDQDREEFLERAGTVLSETSTGCYAWALLPNHAHLLLRTGAIPIAGVMRRLLTGYAGTFNRRHRRHGQLFQNRYKSILCEEDPYLLELVRYIHLNPLRAGLVEDLKALRSYPYTGHSVLMGKAKKQWQDRGYVLRLFGEGEREAKSTYLSFVAKGVQWGQRPELVGGGLRRSVEGWRELKGLRDSGERVKGDERILGGSDFVEQVLREADERFERRSLLKRRGLALEGLMEKVAAQTGVDIKELRSGSRSRRITRARSILCYLGVRELGVACNVMARMLRISPSAVSKSLVRGQANLGDRSLEEFLQISL